MENGLRTRMELSPYNGVRGSERVHLPSDAHDLRLPPHHPGRVAPFNVALHALRPLSSRAPAMCAGRISTDILGRHVARLEGFSAKSFAEISDSRSCSEQSVCWRAGARSEQASPENHEYNHSMFPCARAILAMEPGARVSGRPSTCAQSAVGAGSGAAAASAARSLGPNAIWCRLRAIQSCQGMSGTSGRMANTWPSRE